MPGEFEQYAIYWVPKRGEALTQFGSSWYGWCAESGALRTRLILHGTTIDIPAITWQVWRHGIHAVVKAPFRLRTGCSRFSVEHVLGLLSEESVAFELPRLRLEVMKGCVVLASSHNCSAFDDLVTLAGKAMAALEAHLPADGATSMRKSATGSDATATKDTVVMFPTASAHRFQIPLTDRIDPKIAQEVIEALQPLLEPMLDQPRCLHDVALMGDPGSGRPLRVLELYELSSLQRQCKSGAMPVQGPDSLVPMPPGETSDPGVAI